MVESTRRSGAHDNGDGGIDGSQGPVPPPTRPGCGLSTVFEALLGDRRDEEFLRLALRRRVDLRVAHGLLLVCGPDCDAARLSRAIAGRVPRGVAVDAPVGSPRHAVVVVPSPSRAMWAHALAEARTEAQARQGLVLPRGPMLGLRALRAAYFAALADAGLAVALDLTGPLVGEAELVVPRMLAGLSAADQATLLDPLRPVLALPPAQRSGYVRTIDALFRHRGVLPDAALTLHLHPNTVRYRVDRIEELTGLRLADPQDRMRLDLAAMLVTLRGWPPDLHPEVVRQMRERPERRFRVDAMPDPNWLAWAAGRSDQLAGILAGMDGEVGAQRHHLVARAERDDLGEHGRPDQRRGLQVIGGGVGVDGEAFAVAAARLDQAGRGTVAAAGVERLEGVVSLAADLADLDGADEAVSTHAAQVSLSRCGTTSGGFAGRTHDSRGRFRSAGGSGLASRCVCGYPATLVN
ncbi:MAG TPA: helix-turn-helix domain-containing protein [Candidatus Angelobacter sp.]|jgi:hypothetical protein|nr:helix-turn-helix domain-containing protein [Candidatus Angelobacter sp.]